MKAAYPVMFEPLGIKTSCSHGTALIDLVHEHNIPLPTDCGGLGACGKCRVKVSPVKNLSDPTLSELDLFSSEELQQGERLACQARVWGPVTVTLPQGVKEQAGALGKTGLRGSFAVDPLVERLVLDIEKEPALGDHGLGDLRTFIDQEAGRKLGHWHEQGLHDLAETKKLKGPFTLVRHGKRGVTALRSGARAGSLGLAVDLGTTTIAAYLCDLKSGNILAADGAANPQRRYGEDVISRIGFCNEHPSGLSDLRDLVMETLNGLIDKLCAVCGRDPGEVDEVCLVGNTTMQHIFSGLHPGSLGRAPYMPVWQEGLDLWSGDTKLKLNPACNIHVFPVISGYVGGDAVAAVLAQGQVDPSKSLLVVDLGTNGELVLLAGDKAFATSCATGPAFEGAHISCGVRAAPGAIHKASAGEGPNLLHLEVLGDDDQCQPVGVCGSGLIDLIAVLREQGRILPNGRIKEGAACVLEEDGVGRQVELVPAQSAAGGRAIHLSLKDIRQVQLAKAAMSVGIEMLLENAGVEKVDRTVLTGAFGARFNWRNAVKLGILPAQSAAGQVVAVENSAGVGAVMGLLSAKERHRAEELARHIQVVELSLQPDFNMRFGLGTGFPDLEGLGV